MNEEMKSKLQALIDKEESDFTRLYGSVLNSEEYKRCLMILEGELKIGYMQGLIDGLERAFK